MLLRGVGIKRAMDVKHRDGALNVNGSWYVFVKQRFSIQFGAHRAHGMTFVVSRFRAKTRVTSQLSKECSKYELF